MSTDTDGQWLVNGEPLAAISPGDRGLAYGDGLFETMAWRDGALRFAERHLQRLARGCRRLDLPLPAAELLLEEAASLAGQHGCGTLKLILSRGPGRRGYAPAGHTHPTRAMVFYPGRPAAPAPALRLGLCRTPASINPVLAGLKTLNRLDNVLAAAEIGRRGLDEGIMCTPDGVVVGATAANVFAFRAGVLLTPELSHAGVAGTMRGLVLDCAAALRITSREARISAEELLQMDELFLTNALTGLRRVASLEGHRPPDGELTCRLAQALRERGVAEAGPC